VPDKENDMVPGSSILPPLGQGNRCPATGQRDVPPCAVSAVPVFGAAANGARAPDKGLL